MTHWLTRIAAAALILVVAAGCSNEPVAASLRPSDARTGTVTSASNEDARTNLTGAECQDGGPRGDVLRGSSHLDYDGFRSIDEAIAAVDVVAAGRIAQWSAGRSIIDGSDATRFAVLAIDVDDPVKGVESQRIYVSFDLGTEGLDENGIPVPGHDGSSTVLTVEDAAQAASVGTEVLFLGVANPSVEEEEFEANVHVVDARAGLPDGETLLAAYPQGLLLQGCDGETVSAIVEDGDIDAWVAAVPSTDGLPALTAANSEGSFARLIAAAVAFVES